MKLIILVAMIYLCQAIWKALVVDGSIRRRDASEISCVESAAGFLRARSETP